ncbi:MAG: hypothetical protein ACR2I8_04025, partial [Steroidobacteraceae bacterium]
IDAWREHLAALHESDLPESMQGRFAELRAAMHSAHATGGVTAAEVSVRKMSEKEATRYAVSILEMYSQLAADGEQDVIDAPHLWIVGASQDAEIRSEDLPAFLSRA